MRIKRNQEGFTILELIIASTVFSLIMLLSTTGLIQIGKTYHKGQITSKTQETTRGVIEEISREVQFSNESVQPSPEVNSPSMSSVRLQALCIGDTRYTYVKNKPKAKVSQVNNPDDPNAPTLQHLLWVDKRVNNLGLDDGTCIATDYTNGDRDLLTQNMRLADFDIADSGDNVKLFMRLYYGDFDLTEGRLASDGKSPCESTRMGGQFCASSELNTVVRRRI